MGSGKVGGVVVDVVGVVDVVDVVDVVGRVLVVDDTAAAAVVHVGSGRGADGPPLAVVSCCWSAAAPATPAAVAVAVAVAFASGSPVPGPDDAGGVASVLLPSLLLPGTAGVRLLG